MLRRWTLIGVGTFLASTAAAQGGRGVSLEGAIRDLSRKASCSPAAFTARESQLVHTTKRLNSLSVTKTGFKFSERNAVSTFDERTGKRHDDGALDNDLVTEAVFSDLDQNVSVSGSNVTIKCLNGECLSEALKFRILPKAAIKRRTEKIYRFCSSEVARDVARSFKTIILVNRDIR